MLLYFEGDIKWDYLIANPSIKWTPTIINRVKSCLNDNISNYGKVSSIDSYNFGKYLSLALAYGFMPDNSCNIFEKAVGYLNQFDLYFNTPNFKEDWIWNCISINANIRWEQLDTYYLIHPTPSLFSEEGEFGNKYSFDKEINYRAFNYDSRYLRCLKMNNYGVDIIPLFDSHFWNPNTIQSFLEPYEYEGEISYEFSGLCENKSVAWDLTLFNYVKEHELEYSFDGIHALAKRKRFFDFVYQEYPRYDLLDFFNRLYHKWKR